MYAMCTTTMEGGGEEPADFVLLSTCEINAFLYRIGRARTQLHFISSWVYSGTAKLCYILPPSFFPFFKPNLDDKEVIVLASRGGGSQIHGCTALKM